MLEKKKLQKRVKPNNGQKLPGTSLGRDEQTLRAAIQATRVGKLEEKTIINRALFYCDFQNGGKKIKNEPKRLSGHLLESTCKGRTPVIPAGNPGPLVVKSF